MPPFLVPKIDAREALNFGRVNRLSELGSVLTTAETLALQLAALPQPCLRNDRCPAYESWNLNATDAPSRALRLSLSTHASVASRFSTVAAHHGPSTSSPI